MFNQSKTPANWVHSFAAGDGVRVHVSEKGALKITTIDPSGEEKFVVCLTPKNAEVIVNAAGDIGNFLSSPEYATLLNNKAKVSERNKISLQIEKEKEKYARTMQAAAEALARLNEQQKKIG